MTRRALVTGASRGLGATLAGFLAAQGVDLVVAARGAQELSIAANGWRSRGVEVVDLAGDVADMEHRRRLVEACRQRGGLDILVNNASDLGPSPLPSLSDLPLPRYREILEVNLVAPLALIQEARPLLQRRHGMIINISSDAAVGAYPGWGGYGSSKAALDLTSRTLARELRSEGISVVSVDPGDMRTAMHQAAFPGEDISDRPEPDVTLPFWAWLLGQDPLIVSGGRYRAQGETWEAPHEA